MLNNNVFYHGIIRKTIVAFGSLFSSIYIDRKEGDSVTGNTIQRLQVPLAYAPKEKWLVRLDSDPTLENHIYTTLPRLSFEITGYTYDSTRKTNRMQKIFCGDGTGAASSVFSPVPYNIEISLYILTKTQEDALQIVEQILPTFTPEYTLSIKTVPEMNIIQDIPVILNSISVQDDYDGDFQTRRFVTHTLTFTLKTYLYGNVNSGSKIITDVTVNLNNVLPPGNSPVETYTATGNPTTSTVTNEDWTNNI
jgi:hypothetical protein